MTPPEKLPFAPVLRSLLEEDHPTPDRLIDYRAGRLSPEEAAVLKQHLRSCAECTELLGDLEAFEAFAAPSDAEVSADREAEAAWQRMRGRLPGSQPAEATAPRILTMPQRDRQAIHGPVSGWWKPQTAYAVAATLFIGVVGLLLWGLSLQRRLSDLEKPQPNFTVASLDDDQLRGQAGGEPTLSPRGPSFAFRLHHHRSGDEPAFPVYDAEIRPAGELAGSPLRTITGLERVDDGYFSSSMRNDLPPGAYRLDLFGRKGDRHQKIAEYSFRIAAP